MTTWASTYEKEQPWLVYHYGLTHDKWWPLWNSTRVTGCAKIKAECAICGKVETISMAIPRFGTVPGPEGGKHPKRLDFMYRHLHVDRPHPMAWAKPLLNLDAHQGGIDLALLAARLERELGIETKVVQP